MLSVAELRGLGQQLSVESFVQQLGPFVLIQRPQDEAVPGTRLMGLPPGAMRTTVVRPEAVASSALSLLFQFDTLAVASLPPLQGVEALSVGRQPDCDLVLDHPSVSKRHATIRWDAGRKICSVEDEGSLNGTWLNASVRVNKELFLRNGDIVSFGEVQYWFLLTTTLHARLHEATQGPTSL